MTADGIPKYVQPKELAGGVIGYYWSPPRKLPEKCPLTRLALGTDWDVAKKKAETQNADLEFWLTHGRLPDDPVDVTIMAGSVDHVFEIYRGANPAKKRAFSKLSEREQADYNRLFKRFADYKLKDGRRVGEVMARDLDAPTVDAIYEKLIFAEDAEFAGEPPDVVPRVMTAADYDALKPGQVYLRGNCMWQRGEHRKRVTNYMMAICRRAWGVAARARPELMPVVNPFRKMDLDHSSKETTPATYAELLTFEAKAIEMEMPEIAFGARAAWELLQRVEEVCLTLAWTHWRPVRHPNSVFVRFGKNDSPVWKPLNDDDGQCFYPVLEELIKTVPQRGTLILTHNATKGRKKKDGSAYQAVYRAYTPRFMQKRARLIRIAAGLPEHVTMESFRHGGLTELGDGGLPDTYAQALSRHKKRETLTRYIHRTDAQLKAASRQRAAYRRDAQK